MGVLARAPDDDSVWYHTWNHVHQVVFRSEAALEFLVNSPRSRGRRPLAEFSQRCHQIIIAGACRDPFADFLLFRIDSCIDGINGHLAREEARLLQLPSTPPVNLGANGPVIPSLKTVHQKLSFPAARLLHSLLRYDDLAFLLEGLQEYRVIPNGDSILKEPHQSFRILFELPAKFVSFGCTREHLKERNSIARITIENHLKTGLISREEFTCMDSICKTFSKHEVHPDILSVPRLGIKPLRV